MGIVRKTKSVNTLLHLFALKDNAISAVDLVEELHKKMNKTTVYRILERLEKDGLIHSFIGRNGLKWYAKCNGCSSESHFDTHPHFQCRDCGKIECLELEVSIPTVKNYHVDSVEIFLSGRCGDCFV